MPDQYQKTGATTTGQIAAIWGVTGVCLLLGSAVYRLSIIAIDSFEFSFQWYHWLVLVVNIVFMAHSEGYKGFQNNFAPRVAARARYLKFNPRPLHVIFAPLFCMGYFYATRKRMITAYIVLLGIVLLILIFHQISQPWRGILDVGVIVGLSWGIVSLLIYFVQAMGPDEFEYSADVPIAEVE